MLVAYVNGFWRWPWRRELHVWEIGTEHWFQLSSDRLRLLAMQDHMSCVAACFHDPSASPFAYTLQNEPLPASHFAKLVAGFSQRLSGSGGRQSSLKRSMATRLDGFKELLGYA